MEPRDDYEKHSYEAAEKAREEGFTVLIREKYELLVDLDKTTEGEFLRRLHYVAKRIFQPRYVEIWKSKSGNLHARVVLKTAVEDDKEAVMLQAILGSDPQRELAALFDLRIGNRFYSMLFRPPGAEIRTLRSEWV